MFIRESAVAGSPTFYSISDEGGAGRTLPVVGYLRGDRWFGGVALAVQQIENDSERNQRVFIQAPGPLCCGQDLLSESSAGNFYARGFVGRRLGRRWSVGAGAAAASLNAMDGVDLLYAGALDIEQSGSTAQFRAGAFRDGTRDRLELLVVHHRVDMTHDLTYANWWVDPASSLAVPPPFRHETQLDRTRTWGLHAGYDRRFTRTGWRLGIASTVNRKSHPKIPNYEIQNIPRDPGTTWAYNFGVGLARDFDGTTLGVDVVFEPIWSDTWQEADSLRLASDGRPIRAGEKTIENDFFFTNVRMRFGISREARKSRDMGFQIGVEVRSYDYTLDQRDRLAGSFRDQDEAWMEWSPAAGLMARLGGLDLRYALRLTTGTGQPGVALDLRAGSLEDGLGVGDFIVAPQGPLTLQDATVITHQLSAVIPIR